jgi:hypothetical protein
MKTEILHISEKINRDNAFKSVIAFKKFIEFLEFNISHGPAIKIPYFRWIVKKFRKHPELTGEMAMEKMGSYEEILELVSTCLLPLAADEKILWALGNPASPEIFYSTDGFHELMHCLKHPISDNPVSETADDETEKIMRELQYGMVLEKIYKSPFLKKTEWIRRFEDPDTGLDKYFQIHIDTRFVEVIPMIKQPWLDCSSLSPASVWGEEFKKIEHSISLNQFEARGFSIVTLTDVTAEHALKQVAKLVIHGNQADKKSHFDQITRALQTVVGSKNFEFGIVPFLSINDRPALMYENFPYSIIVQSCWKYEISKKEFTRLRAEIIKNPRTVVWSANEQETDLPQLIGDAFRHSGVTGYVMTPVYHGHQMTGIFEVGTRMGNPMLSESQMLRLKQVLPVITQMIQDIIAKFNRSIENIIKEKFTSIQPAVQWKFNETAWHYLRDHLTEENVESPEEIIFRDLTPLYGSVDIRNSTILRNQALERDFTAQLSLLINVVSNLDYAVKPQLDRILTTARSWLEIILEPLTTQQEIRINEFFDLDVQHELEKLLREEPETREIMLPYFQSIDEENGIAFENRRQLETAMKQINLAVNNFYENASNELQQIFPCYFEKFRTDGVEYDIYAGQSIAPKMPFQKEHLQALKRWQLNSMIKVVHLVNELNSDMVSPLLTTQLLFIHPQTIDITFRKDERRFDVEGAYNIRYHIIKKRIDKAYILNTNERLTQPGKIALVYFDERDADEFRGFIRELQDENHLLEELEELELEPLQGVDGLKALRVTVQMADPKTNLLQSGDLVKAF